MRSNEGVRGGVVVRVWGAGGCVGVSAPCSDHTGTSVWVWVNHVPGFTAAQGHHLQPHHWSAGDGFIPNQQKVRRVRREGPGASTAEGGSKIVSLPPPPSSSPSTSSSSLSNSALSSSRLAMYFVLLLLTTWWIHARGEIFNSSIQVSQSLNFFHLKQPL